MPILNALNDSVKHKKCINVIEWNSSGDLVIRTIFLEDFIFFSIFILAVTQHSTL